MKKAEILRRANEQIIDACTTDQVFRAMRTVTEDIGFKHVVYYLPKMPGAPAAGPVQYLSYPAEWVQHYQESSYIDIDPVVRSSIRSVVPVDWDILDRRNKRVQKLFAEADDIGIGRHGVTLTLRSNDMSMALFTVTSDLGQNDWREMKEQNLPLLQSLGTLVHTRVLELVGKRSSKPPKISARELECIIWCARGLHDQEIADKLGISLSVTRAYLESAKSKLGAITRPNLIGLAIKFGIIAEDFI